MSNKEIEPRSAFEKHGQSIIQVLIAALCIWMANTTNLTATSVAVLTERMQGIKVQLDSVQLEASLRYTKEDAIRDTEIINRRMDRQSTRISTLEDDS